MLKILIFGIIYFRFLGSGDTIFKAIFGNERNINILVVFLRHVFEQSPVKVEFSELIIINPDLPVESKDERKSTVDVLAKN